MRAREFLTEQELSDVHDGLDVAFLSLPYTYMIPELSNSNFYDIYRFGVAIAAVRGEGGSEDKVQDKDRPKFRPESKLGKHPTVSSFDPNVGKVIDQALSKVNRHGKVAVSSSGSEEMKDTSKVSPVRAFKGYPK
jgi:hypothetical protein